MSKINLLKKDDNNTVLGAIQFGQMTQNKVLLWVWNTTEDWRNHSTELPGLRL